jgi:RHH-type proline utilization regulon transcriptional repressor/proline dehydrogenase/delta 1-pyrroline-5-carboxylate dehydrogenase
MAVVAEEVKPQVQGISGPPSTRSTSGKNDYENHGIIDDSLLEKDTQKRGRRLLAEVRRQEKKGRLSDWFYDNLMALTTKDESLKVELFRFVDALPALKTPEAVSQHLQEYLVRPDVKLPPGGAALLTRLSSHALTRRLLAFSSNTGAKMMAKRFIAGRDAHEATAAITRLRRQDLTFTLDLLGEAVTSEADALAYQNKYLELVRDLADISRHWSTNPQTDEAPWGPIPKVNVSVKLSSLYARFDPMAADATCEAAKERLRPILRLAKQNGVFVNFDMEQHDFCTITQRIFQEIFCEPEFRDWTDVGIVIQAYLRRALADLEALRDWARDVRQTPVWVRLVKGAYWDYETIVSAQRGHPVPVYSRKADTDANYEACIVFLVQNWQTLRPAIASHNVRSSARAQAIAAAHQLPPRAVEYQVLFGMGEPIGRALAAQGERVRVYVPFGELLPGMAYLVRRLLENTSNDSFIRSAGEKVNVAKLLKDPAAIPPIKNVARQKSGFTNEPETDFVEPENQRQMQKALAAVQGHLGETVPIIIGGKQEQSPHLQDRRDPSETSRIASRIYFATPEQAERAISTAHAAFPKWRDTPSAERSALLHKVADEFQRRRFEISAWQVFETGKPWREADADVAEAIDFCRFYALEMQRLSEPRKRNVPGEWNEYFYDARGPAVIIAPWNFPLAILTGLAVAALVAGNPVILKPSEQASRVGYFLQEALQAAGVPAGVANFLPGDGEEIGPVLVNDPRVSLIAFTGSKAVGLSIIEGASVVRPGQREIKRVIAELGGKNAIIIDEDADLDEAVLGVLGSTIGFSGQKCSACSRVLVVGSAYEPFCERLAEAVKSIRIGPAEDPATTLGPVVDAASQERVLRYVEIGKSEGRLLAEIPVPDGWLEKGYYVPAAVFADCPADGRLCQEEIFGPILAVLHVASLDEALSIADNTLYALTGGLYSRSPKNIERVRREFRVGNLYINRKITGALVDRQPFGGARMSGIGSKAGGPDYLQQFLVPRAITESVMRRGFAPALDDSAGGE